MIGGEDYDEVELEAPAEEFGKGVPSMLVVFGTSLIAFIIALWHYHGGTWTENGYVEEHADIDMKQFYPSKMASLNISSSNLKMGSIVDLRVIPITDRTEQSTDGRFSLSIRHRIHGNESITNTITGKRIPAKNFLWNHTIPLYNETLDYDVDVIRVYVTVTSNFSIFTKARFIWTTGAPKTYRDFTGVVLNLSIIVMLLFTARNEAIIWFISLNIMNLISAFYPSLIQHLLPLAAFLILCTQSVHRFYVLMFSVAVIIGEIAEHDIFRFVVYSVGLCLLFTGKIQQRVLVGVIGYLSTVGLHLFVRSDKTILSLIVNLYTILFQFVDKDSRVSMSSDL